MKRFLSKSMMFLGVFALIMGAMTTFGINPSYAENLKIIGNNIGLEVDPSGTSLFNLTNMNPGDTNEAKIDIYNSLEYRFQLFMRTERVSKAPSQGEADLFKQMVLTIQYDGDEIYNGSMADFAQSNISLGFLYPGDDKELKATVYLPGAETGNEFQGKSVEVRWVFIAEHKPDNPPTDSNESEDTDRPDRQDRPDNPEEPEEILEISEEVPKAFPVLEQPEIIEAQEEIPLMIPILPRTGAIPAVLYYLAGSLFLGLGIRIKNRE
ncbi:hypothetical protein [Gudongella sp. DL1XJH-153]|uniref:hypothetical protein n=1 Tax=Gudongella sp. DL1XJH-153 TaxID=3409804 RepID=UPI003BB781BD